MSNLNVGCENLDHFIPEEVNILFHSRYFYPNIYHMCNPKNNDNRSNIIRCAKCNMISYCGNLHKSQRETKHQHLCKKNQNLLKSSGCTNLFDFLRRIEDPDKRLKKKQSLIATVEQKLKRKLDSYETQMLLHPRVCCVCLESDPASLFNCQSCAQVSFCKNHINAAEHKDSSCFYYEICLNLDWRFTLDGRFDICVNTKDFPFFPNPEAFQLPKNMDKFLEYVEEVTTLVMKILGDLFWRPVYSKLYSNSLTLMHVLKKLELEVQSGLILHVIGIQNSREKDFADHEVLLHLIPQLKNLKIVVVGKELEQNYKIITHKIRICEKCVTENKTLIVEMTKLPYVFYVESKFFLTPHLITYNSGKSEVHMWAESILKMVKIQAPFVMTTNTKLRAETEHKKMTEHFGYLTSKSSFEKNPFASKRPYRDAREHGLNLENSYIAVYILYEAGTDEQTKKKMKRGRNEIELPDFVKEEERQLRRQKSLQKKKKTLQNELLGNSQNSRNSVENIEKFPESNPDNKDADEGKSKTKKKKKADQISNPARENSLFDKEDNLKDTKEENVPETLESESNATGMSKELLDDHILDTPSQNQENVKKKEDNLVDKGESGAEVSPSDKETEGTSEKSSTEEQRSNSENEKKESKPNSEDNPKDKSTGAKNSETSMPVANRKENSENKIQEPTEGSNKSKKKKSKNPELPSILKQELQKLKNDHSSNQNEASEDKETPKVESTGAKNSETSMPVANRKENSENKIQEPTEGSNKSKKKKKKSKNPELPSILKQELQKLKNDHSSNQNEASEDKETPKVESTSAKNSETSMPVANRKENSENKIQEPTEGSNKSKKKKKKSKNPELPSILKQELQKLQNDHSSNQNEASVDKETPKVESTGAKNSETSMPVANRKENSENKIQEPTEGSNKSKKKKKKYKNPELPRILKQELQKLQNDHSSKQNDTSENKEEASDALKVQTSKSAPIFQNEKSENKVQEQKKGSYKSRMKQNKKSKTEESSEYSIEKDEPLDQGEEASNLPNVNSTSATRGKVEELQLQNNNLLKKLGEFSAQFKSIKKDNESAAVELLKEISMFKSSLEILEMNLAEALLEINDDIN